MASSYCKLLYYPPNAGAFPDLSAAGTDYSKYVDSARVQVALNEIGTTSFQFENLPDGDAHTGIGPFGKGGSKELADMSILKVWLGDAASFTDSNLRMVSLFRSPKWSSEAFTSKFMGEAYELTRLLSMNPVPCHLTGGVYSGLWTIREILLGKTGSANAQGVKVDGLLWEISQVPGWNIYTGDAWTADRWPGDTNPGIPNTNLLPEIGTQVSGFRASRSGSLFQEMKNLCDKVGLVFKIDWNRTLNRLNFIIRKRSAVTDAVSRTFEQDDITGDGPRLANEERLDATLDAVEYWGEPKSGVFGYAGAQKPRFVVRETDESVLSEELIQLIAEQLFAKLTGDHYEGGFTVDPLHTSNNWQTQVNEVDRFNDPKNGFSNAILVVGRVTLEFDAGSVGRPKLMMQIEPDLGFFRSERASQADRYALERQIVVLRDAGKAASTYCQRQFADKKKLSDSGEARRNGTAASDYEDGTQVATW